MAARAGAALQQEPPGFRERIALCTTPFDLERLGEDVARSHDFAHYALIQVPTPKDVRLAPLMLMSNWPDALVEAYDDCGFLKNNPVIDALKTTARPLVWSYRPNARYHLHDPVPERVALFRAHGIFCGVYVTVQEPGGKRAALGFCGDRIAPREAELAELSYFGTLFYERFRELKRTARTRPGHKLSSRETECLTWTASGKTSAEIAIILRLSEHTVNHYLTAACQKLCATNRAHAVYKAMRAGYLD